MSSFEDLRFKKTILLIFMDYHCITKYILLKQTVLQESVFFKTYVFKKGEKKSFLTKHTISPNHLSFFLQFGFLVCSSE